MSRRKDHDNYCSVCNSQLKGEIQQKIIQGVSKPICKSCFKLLYQARL